MKTRSKRTSITNSRSAFRFFLLGLLGLVAAAISVARPLIMGKIGTDLLKKSSERQKARMNLGR
jgi:hypothetical protein